MEKLLIVGTGMLGKAIGKRAEAKGWEVITSDTSPDSEDSIQLDIRDQDRLAEVIKEVSPSVLINTAAITNTSGIESDENLRKLAYEVNADAVQNLAQACLDNNISFVHFSSDEVFDGKNPDQQSENNTEAINPLSEYAKSKRKGEELLFELMDGTDEQGFFKSQKIWAANIRTMWLFGPWAHNLVSKIAEMAKAGQAVSGVVDQYGSPTYTLHLADAVLELLENRRVHPGGIYHMTNQGRCSRHEFISYFLEKLGYTDEVTKMTWQEANDKFNLAPAAKIASLVNTRDYIGLPHWQKGVNQFVENYLLNKQS